MNKRRLGFSLLFLLATAIIACVFLLNTETGSRWLLQQVFALAPGEFSTAEIKGKLVDRVQINGFKYQGESGLIQVNHLDLKWQPEQLLNKRLTINHIFADDIDLKLNNKVSGSDTTTDFSQGLNLLLKPDIAELRLTNISVEKNGVTQHINQILLSAKTEAERVNISTFSVVADLGKAEAEGFISTGKNFPLDLKLTWQVNLGEHGILQGKSKFTGDMIKLNLDTAISSPAKLTLAGNAQNLLTAPRFELNGDWKNLNWPLATKQPRIRSPQGSFSVHGVAQDYQFKLNGELTQPQLELAFVNLDARAGLDNINIKQLEIKSDHGVFKLQGPVIWRDKTAFDISAQAQSFNPAFIIPELPGSLSINSRLQGKIDPAGNQIDADITAITGQLRGQPFDASGKLLLTGERLKVNELKLASGINSIYLNGSIEKTKGTLDADIDLPKLSGLWPGLTGSVKGGGRLHGGWQRPALNFTLTGNQLRFDQHGAKALNLDVAYSPDERKTSVVKLSAETITSGTLAIDRLTLDGKGALSQHQVNFELISPKGNAAVALAGGWREPLWQARLTTLKLTEATGKIWSLAKSAPLRIEKKASGAHTSIDEVCLVNQSASLCGKADFAAGGDFGLDLAAKSLPAELLRPFLPPTTQVATHLDGKVNLQQKNHVLTGDYQLATSPTLISLSTQTGVKQFNLKPSTLAGTVNGETILANADFNLSANDFVRGRLTMNIGKAQTLVGNIAAQISDFSPVQAFVPQISDIKGTLSADLKIGGRLQQPQLEGFVNLSDSGINSGRIGLQQLNFQGRISASNGQHLLLTGSAIPVINNPPNAHETVNLKTLMNFTADIRQNPGLTGEFQLNLPATTITLARHGAVNDIVLGQSSIKGSMVNNTLFADMAVALMAQDAIRGRMQLGLDERKQLSAQVDASIRDFRIMQAFTPDLSNIKGMLTVDLTATGTAVSPKLTGNFHLNGGALDIASLGISVNQIDLHAGTPPLADDILQVRGSAKSGAGRLKLDGTVKLDPELNWPVDLRLTGQDFEVAKMPEAQVAVSPDLLLYATSGQTKITGKIDVPTALIKIQDIPENAVKVSKDEIILGADEPETEPIKAPGLFADVRVLLGKNCNFTGQGLTTDLNGNLRILKTASKIAMQGSINLSNASYKSYGQNLTVRKGQFVFTGPIENPWVNVEAIRLSKDRKVTAVLALHGPLDNPQTQVSSEPSLPESEALAYLLTGAPLSQVGKSEGGMLASAAIAYGADQMGWLANEFGITDFGVQEGNNLKDTLLVMGRYLNPDFYMGAKVGMFNKQAVLVLKHKVFKGFNVETQAGTSQRIKLNYEFDSD